MVNPYLAKLHSLNFAKTALRDTDKTGKTGKTRKPQIPGCVSFVGAQEYRNWKNHLRTGAQPDAQPHSENLPIQSTTVDDQPWGETEEERAAIIEYDGGATRTGRKRWHGSIRPARPVTSRLSGGCDLSTTADGSSTTAGRHCGAAGLGAARLVRLRPHQTFRPYQPRWTALAAQWSKTSRA